MATVRTQRGFFSEKKIVELKTRHPGALLIAHPECEAPVLKMADFVGSTSALLAFATRTSSATTFIVATEAGILHQMRKAAPHKTFLPAPPEGACSCNECPYMKANRIGVPSGTLATIFSALELVQMTSESAFTAAVQLM